jgi:hypothetical protein
MRPDPIVAQHRIRERHAKQFGYNLRRTFQDLKEEQESSQRRVVSLPRKRTVGSARSYGGA